MPPPPPPFSLSALLPTSKYPAHEHLDKVLSILSTLLPASSAPPTGLLFLRGTPSRLHEDSDQAVAFRQRRAFLYLSGCELPDCCIVYELGGGGAGAAGDASESEASESEAGKRESVGQRQGESKRRRRSTLFIPPVVDADVVWSGLPTLPAEALARYDVDAVSDAGEDALAALLRASPGPIWTLDPSHLPAGVPCASVAATPSSPSASAAAAAAAAAVAVADPALLRRAIDAARVTKTPHELALLRAASAVTARAHLAAMRAGRRATHEAQLEAAFHAACIAAGARTQAYDSIVASGADAATLHYVRNDKAIVLGASARDGGDAARRTLNVLVDAGCEVRGYAADVTRTFPAGGRWSRESRGVYDVVLAMRAASLAMLRAGVRWEDVHARAHRACIAGLLALGILRPGPGGEGEGEGEGEGGGDAEGREDGEDEGEGEDEKRRSGGERLVERILASRVSTAFFPHGLGHYLGLDTHDTGGRADHADPDPMYRYPVSYTHLTLPTIYSV